LDSRMRRRMRLLNELPPLLAARCKILTRLLHASYTPLTRLLHASYTSTRLLHASYTPLTNKHTHQVICDAATLCCQS
jgi:hypothetical protein